MSQETHTLSIELLGKTWQVRCSDNQAQDLQKCGQLLNTKMHEIATGGKITGNERILIMAAINAIYDLQIQQNQKDLYIESLSSRIRELQNQVAKPSTETKK